MSLLLLLNTPAAAGGELLSTDERFFTAGYGAWTGGTRTLFLSQWVYQVVGYEGDLIITKPAVAGNVYDAEVLVDYQDFDTFEVALQFLNVSNSVLATHYFADANNDLIYTVADKTAPAGTTQVRISLTGRVFENDFERRIRIDDVSLFETAGSSSQALTLPYLNDTDTLFTPATTAGAVTVTLPFLDDPDALELPTAALGAVTLTLPLLSDADDLLAPTVSAGGAALTLPFLNDPDTLLAPSAAAGGAALTLPFLNDPDTLELPTVGSGAASLTLPLLVDGDGLLTPVVAAGAVALAVPLLNDTDTLLAPSLAPAWAPKFRVNPL
jgi:hypothetical protein